MAPSAPCVGGAFLLAEFDLARREQNLPRRHGGTEIEQVRVCPTSAKYSLSKISSKLGPLALDLAQPILHFQVLDAGEFFFVVGDNGVVEGECLRGDEQVVGADWSADLFQART